MKYIYTNGDSDLVHGSGSKNNENKCYEIKINNDGLIRISGSRTQCLAALAGIESVDKGRNFGKLYNKYCSEYSSLEAVKPQVETMVKESDDSKSDASVDNISRSKRRRLKRKENKKKKIVLEKNKNENKDNKNNKNDSPLENSIQSVGKSKHSKNKNKNKNENNNNNDTNTGSAGNDKSKNKSKKVKGEKDKDRNKSKKDNRKDNGNNNNNNVNVSNVVDLKNSKDRFFNDQLSKMLKDPNYRSSVLFYDTVKSERIRIRLIDALTLCINANISSIDDYLKFTQTKKIELSNVTSDINKLEVKITSQFLTPHNNYINEYVEDTVFKQVRSHATNFAYNCNDDVIDKLNIEEFEYIDRDFSLFNLITRYNMNDFYDIINAKSIEKLRSIVKTPSSIVPWRIKCHMNEFSFRDAHVGQYKDGWDYFYHQFLTDLLFQAGTKLVNTIKTIEDFRFFITVGGSFNKYMNSKSCFQFEESILLINEITDFSLYFLKNDVDGLKQANILHHLIHNRPFYINERAKYKTVDVYSLVDCRGMSQQKFINRILSYNSDSLVITCRDKDVRTLTQSNFEWYIYNVIFCGMTRCKNFEKSVLKTKQFNVLQIHAVDKINYLISRNGTNMYVKNMSKVQDLVEHLHSLSFQDFDHLFCFANRISVYAIDIHLMTIIKSANFFINLDTDAIDRTMASIVTQSGYCQLVELPSIFIRPRSQEDLIFDINAFKNHYKSKVHGGDPCHEYRFVDYFEHMFPDLKSAIVKILKVSSDLKKSNNDADEEMLKTFSKIANQLGMHNYDSDKIYTYDDLLSIITLFEETHLSLLEETNLKNKIFNINPVFNNEYECDSNYKNNNNNSSDNNDNSTNDIELEEENEIVDWSEEPVSTIIINSNNENEIDPSKFDDIPDDYFQDF